ncbi:MAG: hypothetical protein WCL28_13740, partial [bacterium]
LLAQQPGLLHESIFYINIVFVDFLINLVSLNIWVGEPKYKSPQINICGLFLLQTISIEVGKSHQKNLLRLEFESISFYMPLT